MMRINKLSYKAYGKLEDIALDLHPEITVVYGNNEAGKSTIFNSISTLLFGFRPASREKHPYAHWYKNEINFSGILQKDTELFLVERRLISMPKLTLTALSTNMTRNLRNESLSFLPNVSEQLYDAVFHLTADDLNRADKDSWEQIQEKLIFNYGTQYLNKTSDVMKRLEQDVNALWRKDKKGNPEMNQLNGVLLNLMQEKNALEAQNDQLKQKIEWLDQVNETLAHCQSERHKNITLLKDLREKLPKKALKEKVSSLLEGLYKIRAFEKLNPKSVERWEQLLESVTLLQKKIDETTEEIRRLQGTLNPLTETCAHLIRFKSSAGRLEFKLTQLLAKEQEVHVYTQERVALEEKIERAYKYLFGEQAKLTQETRTHIKQIHIVDLMTLVQNIMEGQKKNDVIKQKQALLNQNTKQKVIGFIVVGVIASIVGILIKPLGFLSLLGFGLVGYGFASYAPSKRPIEIQVDLNALEEKVNHLMGPLTLPKTVYLDVSLRFFTKLEELMMLLMTYDQLWQKNERLLGEVAEIQAEMAAVLTDHKIDISGGVVLSLQFALSQIEKCEKQKYEEDLKHSKLEHLTQMLTADQVVLDSKLDEKLELQKAFEHFGDGFFDIGFDKFKENTDILKKVSLYTDEIERLPFTDEDLEEVSEEKVEQLEIERLRHEEEEKQLLLNRSDLMNEISRLRESRSVEEVTSEILVTKDSLSDLEEKRDTLMMLMEMLKYADERFRLDNQPDIINQVSYYMRYMTNGKYKDVMISDNLELQFLVEGELLPLSKAFSKGTIQQLFFAYRLAVIDALDPDRELPLILDEVFVNWDAIRLNQTLALLSEIAAHRQIVFFTCHLELAERFNELSNAKIIEVKS